MEAALMQEITTKDATYAVSIHQHDVALPFLLMLHGFMGDRRVFDHLIPKLSKDCNPVTIDLLGHGNSTKPHKAARYNETHQVQDLISIIEQLNFSSLFLFGYSMGGRLALKTALKAPELFSGLILESTTYGITDKKERAQRRKADADRAQQITRNYTLFLSEWEKIPLFNSPLKVNEQLASKYKKIHLEQDPKAMAASITGFSTGVMEPVSDRLVDFTKPTMIITGSGDTKYSELSRYLASYFKRSRQCHIRAGHRVHLDNPGRLAQEIILFIQQNSSL